MGVIDRCPKDLCSGYLDHGIGVPDILVCPLVPQNTVVVMNPDYLKMEGGGVGCPLIAGENSE